MLQKFKGNVEDVERFSKRLVRATKQHTQDCKTLLTLMGVPIIDVSWLVLVIFCEITMP